MKKIFLTVVATLGVLAAFAQDAGSNTIPVKQQNRHEIWLGGGGGISSLQYCPSIGDHNTGYGYLGSLSYTYYFNYNWGISIGGEYQFLQAKYNLNNIADVGRGSDILDQYIVPFSNSTDYFTFQVAPRTKLKEVQEVVYINVPLVARYQMDFPCINSEKLHKLVFSAGLKAGIPLEGNYYTTGTVETSALDPDTRDELTDLSNHGLGTYSYDKYKQTWEGKLNFIGTLEAGVKWQFGRKWGLYTGLFADLGLNDIIKGRKDYNSSIYEHYVEYNPAGLPPKINTITVADYGRVDNINGGLEVDRKSFVDRVTTLAVGIKLAATFGWRPFDRQEKVKKSAATPWEDPWNKPVTGNQMRELLKEQTGDLTDAQHEEFEKLKQFIHEELKQPDLSAPIYCFDFDRENIPDEMKEVLDHKADLLKKYPALKLTIEGHTDYAGSDKYNYDLGLRRAKTAKYYLVSKGVAGSRLTTTSKGRKEPVIKNTKSDKKANCANRRVEFLLK
jgi:outer membrane protein OmpA-like peptidoglycan-associated protein